MTVGGKRRQEVHAGRYGCVGDSGTVGSVGIYETVKETVWRRIRQCKAAWESGTVWERVIVWEGRERQFQDVRECVRA